MTDERISTHTHSIYRVINKLFIDFNCINFLTASAECAETLYDLHIFPNLLFCLFLLLFLRAWCYWLHSSSEFFQLPRFWRSYPLGKLGRKKKHWKLSQNFFLVHALCSYIVFLMRISNQKFVWTEETYLKNKLLTDSYLLTKLFNNQYFCLFSAKN